HYDADGGLVLGTDGVTGGIDVPLTWDPAGLPAAVLDKFPHLSGYQAFKIPADRLNEIPEALRGQLAVSAKSGDGTLVDATSLQIQGVLDDLYTYEGPLGATFAAGMQTLRVWAPTARSVKAVIFPDVEQPMTFPMTLDTATGVWSATGSWYGREYVYEVEVFVRSTGQVETNRVTDPYSVALTRNSAHSLLVDLNDPALKPAGWDSLAKPRLDAFEDVVLYELHVRDFSASDPLVPEALKGTYKAFTLTGSHGMQHLAALANAGLTHIHLLPAFDITSIDEDRSTWLSPAGDLASYPPDSDQQQAAVMAVAGSDGFNWGYDPWHYTVPEGSYSTDPDGTARNREFREMVQALSGVGLRVVMDVVYNHTSAAGQNDRAVLDRIVPGYYHRLNADGNIETSTCCQNTASEFNMMEKLLIDSVVTWAKQYKVDGFRFDIMGHHMKRNLLKLRQALDALTPAADGVDGSKIYLYGEGWNFGEVANNARGVQATQANMAGTGIGTFNDRLRDGARGGGPFSGIQEQGFLTGLYDDPNATNQGTPADQLARLLQETDWVRVGMAGGLADYELIDRNGNLVRAAEIDYNGQPSGYTADPQELINYVEAHDNDTLFDAIHLKASASATMADRVRMQNLGMSLLGLSQGIPFYHAGVDLLRSKSLDRNSYNSGDWFNKLDFTAQDNNWGKGLPPAQDNQSNWPIMAPLLADQDLKPAPADIQKAVYHFREVLKIRKSSKLFRLGTGEEIQDRLAFLNTGPSQIPGLIAMTVTDVEGEVDHQVKRVLVALNASKEARTLAVPCAGYVLHPVQTASVDPVVQGSAYNAGTCTVSVPGRAAAVFWERRPVAEQLTLLIGEVNELVASGVLNHGQGNALRTKLENARSKLLAGKTGPAASLIEAFIDQVEDLAAQGILTADQAAALIHDAEEALADLGLAGLGGAFRAPFSIASHE
ncbi:MAG: pullulanase-type alpha-1,6-glucosidase, partial [Thermoanaerobaculia bacterium]